MIKHRVLEPLDRKLIQQCCKGYPVVVVTVTTVFFVSKQRDDLSITHVSGTGSFSAYLRGSSWMWLTSDVILLGFENFDESFHSQVPFTGK